MENKKDNIPSQSFIDDFTNIINQGIEVQLMSGRKIIGKAKNIDRLQMTMTIALGEDLFNSETIEINIVDINREYGIKITKWREVYLPDKKLPTPAPESC